MFIINVDEILPSTNTNCVLSVRKSNMNLHRLIETPRCNSFCTKRCGMIALNALLKSINRDLAYELRFSRC